jgi:uncharacterized lipoprotein YddW (UPF0748 family)
MPRLLLHSFFLSILGLLSCTTFAQEHPVRELRSVWIATVANIDWPSKSGLTLEEQQQQFIQILDFHKANGINAVFVQIRPAADAFYPSRYEPWSSWLTGKLGKAPFPFYDPLNFMISEAHARGMDFHAWLNPYRALANVTDTIPVPGASLVAQHPGWFVKYGKAMYFNPGLDEVRDHVTRVVADIVNRYDIEGIHFDDYFYPYKIAELAFPDSATFIQHKGSFSAIDDWRRNNVSQLIKQLSDTIRSIKPHVQFGVSPFGVWRNQDKDPRGSATHAFQTCYDDLYADILLWLREGWIDYAAPQLYLPVGHDKMPYEILVKWWNENSFGKTLYIGQATYRINSERDKAWKDPRQLFDQIRINRQFASVKGSIFFSAKSFKSNPLGVNDSLKTNYYRYPAITPPHSSAKEKAPTTDVPLTFIGRKDLTIYWKAIDRENVSASTPYILYRGRYAKKNKLPLTLLAIIPHNAAAGASSLYQYTDTTARPGKKYVYTVVPLDKFKRHRDQGKTYGVKINRNSWSILE